MRTATILSSGSYAPERVVPNSYFDELLGTEVSPWLEQNVEIYERRWAAEDESTADLCVEAANRAIKGANIDASDLDLIIIATDTPEFISPSTASVVQHRLGAKHAGVFDINTACAGFVTALDTASKYIQADEQYKHVLVIGAYVMSKYLNMADKKTVTLFADGAGAMVLGADESGASGVLATELRALGHYHDGMGIYGGGTHMPISEKTVANQDHLLKFIYKFPPELNPDMWSDMTRKLCTRLAISPADVDRFFLTQININSIRETMDRLELPHTKAHTVMHQYGYTGSACIPMAFDDAVQKNLIKRGDMLFLIGSGGGLAFASAALRY